MYNKIVKCDDWNREYSREEIIIIIGGGNEISEGSRRLTNEFRNRVIAALFAHYECIKREDDAERLGNVLLLLSGKSRIENSWLRPLSLTPPSIEVSLRLHRQHLNHCKSWDYSRSSILILWVNNFFLMPHLFNMYHTDEYSLINRVYYSIRGGVSNEHSIASLSLSPVPLSMLSVDG